jgi:hypothetical protein
MILYIQNAVNYEDTIDKCTRYSNEGTKEKNIKRSQGSSLLLSLHLYLLLESVLEVEVIRI